jgi:hypothetical protein
MLLKTRSRPLVKRERRMEFSDHLAYVASLGCCVPGCGAPASVHHLRVAGTDAAAGRRSSDRWAVPVCHRHHQGQGGIHHSGHQAVAEWAWWARIGIDPLALAERLWAESHAWVMP